MQKIFSLLCALIVISPFLGGCEPPGQLRSNERFGPSAVINRSTPVQLEKTSAIDYERDIKPILDSRCAVCHGCYDAPCQLNLTAFPGVERGANKARVYDGTRLLAANLTRLFDDGRSVGDWRSKGFSPVLNERKQTLFVNTENSVLARMLMLKHLNPLPKTDRLPDSFDFSLDRDSQQCPTAEEFDRFAGEHALWGMPYGLPGLKKNEEDALLRWLKAGSPYKPPEPPGGVFQAHIQQWEAFFNGDSLKQRLMSRYIFEHLFLANLYFDDVAPLSYFQLVRSKTPPGVPIELIATRRPYDDPGVARVYYRLRPLPGTVLVKTHLPYALNSQRMEKYRTWFLDNISTVNFLPSYRPEVASNPFETFKDIPVNSRYRFLLDEAQFIVMGFMKGPVCRGQVALNVIDDRFWVFFVAPEKKLMPEAEAFLAQESNNLRLPSEEGSEIDPLSSWLKYSALQNKYLESRSARLTRLFKEGNGINLDLIWNGDGVNSNAALTVFRNFDSASVVKGLIGESPKTAWVVDYTLLERMHYLLVAGYDVYGNIGHQLASRLYMDFMRMEAEFHFLGFLPQQARVEERDYWYRGASDSVKNYIFGNRYNVDLQTAIRYAGNKPKEEFFGMLKQRLSPVLDRRHEIAGDADQFVAGQLARLVKTPGLSAYWMPETAFLLVENDDAAEKSKLIGIYTLIHDDAHSNISQPFRESNNRLPEEDRLSIAKGIIGAYPNVFLRAPKSRLRELVIEMQHLNSESDYQALLSKFGVRRTHPDFWQISDIMHREYGATDPVEAGLLDYNRYENR
ncbi:fatty acid cis/trans isomerase [Candidatus Methylospira mobilis]|uniref:fatty acid cis/trans isomerase n=1 Tax=Candidatus Methylospira mobilis TaxID=1808979 RepID=UPI0028E4F1A9|nr:fatty acid cis/trans isomerase [Candidatus Methylospira mobilis]WNV05718.1 fatty acid cis/trans isomerase [Candidatus Methylospira mobilis]